MQRSALTLGSILCCAALFLGCPDENLGEVFPDIELSDRELDFGLVPVLHTSTLEPVVTNRGLARLTIEQIEITGDDAGYFSWAEIASPIGVGAERELAVTFQPEEERVYRATLLIHSDDPEDPVVEAELVGEGRTVSEIEVDPVSLHFGLVGEGVIAMETFSIHSVGTADLIVEEMVFEDGTPAAYAAIGSWVTPARIEEGTSIELAVTFSPSEGETQAEGAILITSTDPGRRVVRLPLSAEISRAPVALCGDGETIMRAPGDVVVLDGGESFDPDGNEPLSFEWDVVRRPLTSLTELMDDEGPNPSIELDVSGTWEISLSVRNSLGTPSLTPCRTTIRAVPAERLFIELVWDHSLTDLDLHVLAPGGTLFGDLDCWWGNPEAFGCSHSGDDLAGFGPEWAKLPDPAPGTYQVIVRFPKDNGAREPATKATVRVYQYGVLEAEIRRTLPEEGVRWNVLTIDWPSGEVEALDTVQASP